MEDGVLKYEEDKKFCNSSLVRLKIFYERNLKAGTEM